MHITLRCYIKAISVRKGESTIELHIFRIQVYVIVSAEIDFPIGSCLLYKAMAMKTEFGGMMISSMFSFWERPYSLSSG